MPLFYIGYGILLILVLFDIYKFRDKLIRILFILSGVLLLVSIIFPNLQFENIVINSFQLLFIYLLISIFVYCFKFNFIDLCVLILSSLFYYFFITSGYNGFFTDNICLVFILLIINIVGNSDILKSFQLLLVNGFALTTIKYFVDFENFGFVFVNFDNLFSLILYFLLFEIIFYVFFKNINLRRGNGNEKVFFNNFSFSSMLF